MSAFVVGNDHIAAQSAAYRLCEAIIHKLIRHVPGYDDAPWEWKGPTEKRYSLMDMATGRY
jgi:hypothetical protein